MEQIYMQPVYGDTAFHCPNCGAYSAQSWENIYPNGQDAVTRRRFAIEDMRLCYCQHCHEPSIWYKEMMIYPSVSSAPLPNTDIPDDIKIDYLEARDILNKSPRGTAALLRLTIQKLCVHLGEEGKNINTDIKELVKKGLEPRIQKALDIVRVVGNNAVHPGQIDLADDRETARKLFGLINLIAHDMITRPKELENFYESLPQDAREAIERRDQ